MSRYRLHKSLGVKKYIPKPLIIFNPVLLKDMENIGFKSHAKRPQVIDSPLRSRTMALEKVSDVAEMLGTEAKKAVKMWQNAGTPFPETLHDACVKSGIPIGVLASCQILGADNIETASVLECILESQRWKNFIPDNMTARRWQQEKENRTHREYMQALFTLSMFDVDSTAVKHQINKFLDRIRDWTTTNAMLETLHTLEQVEGEKDA